MYLRESLVDWDVVDFDSLQNGWVIEFLVKDPIGTPEQGVFCLEQCYTSKKKCQLMEFDVLICKII
jgi:hypothetical protein